MQIAEILSTHAEPGALVVDLTRPEAELGVHAVLPPEARVGYVQGLAHPPGALPGLALVLQHLPAAAVPASAGQGLALDLGHVAQRVVHVIFMDRMEAIPESGLLEAAARHGLLLSDSHATGHAVFPFAVTLTSADSEDLATRQVRLRTVNEYRFGRWQLREQQSKLERWGSRIEKLNATLRRRNREIERLQQEQTEKTRALVEELETLRREGARLSRSVEELETRAQRAEAWLSRIRSLLEEARDSMSFRVAFATRGALRDAAQGPRFALASWLRAFNGPDEVLSQLERELGLRKRRDGSAE